MARVTDIQLSIKDEMNIEVTCMIPSNSLLSLASSLRISSSMVFAWFLAADDWSFRLRDIIAAVCDAAVADSCCAV